MPRSVKRLINFDGHTVVIGITGSGKTYAIKQSLRGVRNRGVLFFNTQFEDMPNDFIKTGGRDSLSSIKQALRGGHKLNFLPSDDLEIQKEQLSAIIKALYDGSTVWNIIFVVDEVHLFCDDRQSKRQLIRLATTGRRFGIAGVFISQRPAEIHNTLMTQSRKFVIFQTNMETEYFKRYKMPYQQIEDGLLRGGEFSYIEYDWRNYCGPFRI